MDDEYESRDRQRWLSNEIDRMMDNMLTPTQKRSTVFFSVLKAFLVVALDKLFF